MRKPAVVLSMQPLQARNPHRLRAYATYDPAILSALVGVLSMPILLGATNAVAIQLNQPQAQPVIFLN
jgi:hypothetical protein